MKLLDTLRFGIVFFAGILGIAQAGEWSDEQAEVWSAIEVCNDHIREKRIDAFKDCIHDDFSGWLYSEPVPRGKDNFEKIVRYFVTSRDIVAAENRPVSILVYDNFAIIHYFFIEITKDEGGNEDYSQGRWTDVMVKENGKWRWIADHGGSRPD